MENNEEQLEVLNEKGEKTGELVARSVAHREGILHGASHTFIYKKGQDGKLYILLQRRSHSKDSFPDCLDISSAGHMSEGIDFRETAQKELQEELGIEVEDSELVEAFTQRFSKVSEQHGEVFNNNEINKVYILKKDVEIEKVKLQEEEVSEVVWVEAETIVERLQAGDTEYCLDKVEFAKVLETIKEREKMEEEILAKMHEDIIFNGRFNNSRVVRELSDKTNQYGEYRQAEVILKGEAAATISRSLSGTDDKVATGIAIGVELGKPMYEKIGEEFLKSKIESYKKSGLGVALTKSMLKGISGERVDKIVNGVEHILEGQVLETEEEKAACLAIVLYDQTNKLTKNRGMRYSTYLTNAMKTTKANGTVSFVETDSFRELKESKTSKDLVYRNPDRAKELESCFNYYISDFSKIPQDFVEALEGYSEVEIVAYYVMSLGEEGISRVFEHIKTQIDR